jgi:phosphoribosyl-ATP pyrophosphohydrolase/phosphoribosyl-AMP cyclohydrolase
VYATIRDRIENQPEGSYVARLHREGLDRVLKKVGEEAGEVIIASKNRSVPELTAEASDLVFHLLFAMAEVGVRPEDLAAELERRHAAPRRQG